ncbi:MAG: formyltransferase family protein [Nitrospirota bacterium]
MSMKILFLGGNMAKGLADWLEQQGETVIYREDKVTIDDLIQISPDMVASYNYKYLISQKIIEHVKGNAINLHISLLPWNKGAYPNIWSFLEDTPKGVTIHYIDEGVDTGDIIVQKEVFIDENTETLKSSYEILHREIQTLFKENWSMIKNNKIISQPQTGGEACTLKENLQKSRHLSERKGWIPLSENLRNNILNFWNERAILKEYAGTKDLIAKKIEIESIAQFICDGLNILEIGCGNGITAIELASRFRVNITGIDFSEKMIEEAKKLASNYTIKGVLNFLVGDVRNLPNFAQKFDLVYTERALINLPDWFSQRQAIIDITKLLVEGGCYIMCENSQDGLDKINFLRQKIGLSCIIPPWHNRYFRDSELDEFCIPGVKMEKVVHFSSTYYFLSRVVNAWLAMSEDKEPEYDAPINRLALKLPSCCGNMGQGKIWVWRKLKEN